MSKLPEIYIGHILESIDIISQYTKALTLEDFISTLQIQDAVIRRIEIIGEAAKNVSLDFKAQYPQIPWKQLAGMRDVLIHHYFGIDLKLTWKTVQQDLPVLREELLKILGQ